MADTKIPETDDWVQPTESNGSNATASIRSLIDAVPPVTSAVGKVLGAAPIPGLPSSGGRNTEKDGLHNQIETFATTHGEPIWMVVQAIPPVRTAVNRFLTNSGIMKFPTRPEPFTTKADYTSWDTATDRTFSARHLPAVPPRPGLPPVDEFEALYRRDVFIESPKSTVLFSYFAQWFTDGFLRMDRTWPHPDLRRNESNHEIDLTNLYGLKPAVTDQLRAHEGGLLKSQLIKGEEFPPYLYSGGKQKAEFSEVTVLGQERWPAKAENKFFAMGGDTTNMQIGFVMHNVLFLREHNRIARVLQDAYPTWDDERLFQTARSIMIVLLIKIVIEDYINHITPYLFKLRLEPRSFPNEPWYRQNWMATEFQLLYRWHSLVPPSYHIGGKDYAIEATLFNTETVVRNGLGPMFEDASLQTAGQVGLKNTPPGLLWEVEKLSIQQGRVVQLASYNDYRELAGFPRVTEFNQITGRRDVREELRRLYGHVDNIEFFTGIFAEDARTNSVLPGMIGRMVGLDAFSQVYTNPLLARRIYNEKTFSPVGMQIIETTKTLSQVLNRNVPQRPEGYFVSMTRKGWKRA